MNEPAKTGGGKRKRGSGEEPLVFHPLFYPAENHTREEQEEYTADKIVSIMVGRYDADGKFRCALRRYMPDELKDLPAVHEAHGGGVYDLMAMNAQNRMVRKTRWTIEGTSRSLNGVDAPQPSTQGQQGAAAPLPQMQGGTTDPLTAMVGLMGTIVVASMQQTGQIVAALVANGKTSAPDPNAGLAPVLEALAKFMPQPAPVAAVAPQQSPVAAMKELYEFQQQIQTPPSKEESTAEVIGAVMPAVGQVIGQFLQNRAPALVGPAG